MEIGRVGIGAVSYLGVVGADAYGEANPERACGVEMLSADVGVLFDSDNRLISEAPGLESLRPSDKVRCRIPGDFCGRET